MIRRFVTAGAVALLAATALMADFSYQETSTITGGALATMMKVVGVFSKNAREPIRATIAVKGNRMARRTQNEATITDLDAQTITTIDLQKKTYSVMTFEEMKKAIEAAAAKAKGNKKEDAPEMKFKVSVEPTGKTRQISGVDTKEVILKMDMEAQDQKSGEKGGMTVNVDMWLASDVAGYQEMKDFYRRMAEKINWTPSGNMFMANPEVSKGMADVYKEASKLEGVPVLQLTTMNPAGMPPPGSPEAQQQEEAQRQQQQAERPSLGGVLGGRLGLGGLGRKKSEPKQEETAQKAPSSPGSLLEMTTEMSAFSTSADASMFEVPAGFKKVDAKF